MPIYQFPHPMDWDGNELLLSDILGTDEDVIYKDIETEVEISLLKKAMLSLNCLLYTSMTAQWHKESFLLRQPLQTAHMRLTKA